MQPRVAISVDERIDFLIENSIFLLLSLLTEGFDYATLKDETYGENKKSVKSEITRRYSGKKRHHVTTK